MHQSTNETTGVVAATLCSGIAQPIPKYSPILTNHILSRESILFPTDIHIVRFIECKNAYALAEMAKQYTWYSLFATLPYDGVPSPDNPRTPTFVPHSGVLANIVNYNI